MAASVCILCPGQGAQAVGMGKDFYAASDAAKRVFDRAAEVLGFDIASLCFEGPEDRLNHTDIAQPAIFVTSIASYRAAEATGQIDEAWQDVHLAGLSLGEYTALALADVFSFEDGLGLVAARGRLMQEAAEATPSGMVAILGASEEQVGSLCEQSAQGQVLVPANFNAPGQIVVSGHADACGRVAEAAGVAGFKPVVLKVAGAFHSPLMQLAAERMREELGRVTFREPASTRHVRSVTAYSNVTAKPHGDVASIKELLVRQIVEPVRWEQTMQALAARPDTQFVELAPGRTLTGMLKKINRRLPVESFATADALKG